jgi:hypothetical protein
MRRGLGLARTISIAGWKATSALVPPEVTTPKSGWRRSISGLKRSGEKRGTA